MPLETGPAIAGAVATGTVQCPWCWAVWLWSNPSDPNYLTNGVNAACPRCGNEVYTLPESATSLSRFADLTGFPSE